MSNEDAIKIAKVLDAKHEGLVYNLESEHQAVEIENEFNLYRAIYHRLGYDWNFVYASKSDKSAIKTAFEQRPEDMRCIYVDRLILREDDEPTSIIIWGN